MGQSGRHSNNSPFINVRKMAALDIVFHSTKVIIIEFLVAMGISGAISAFLLVFATNHTTWSTILGIYFLGITTNYIVLLCFALIIRSRERAAREVEDEMHDISNEGCRYTLQSILLILVPFALAFLALYQVITRRG